MNKKQIVTPRITKLTLAAATVSLFTACSGAGGPCASYFNTAKAATGLCKIPAPNEEVLESCETVIGDCNSSDLALLASANTCVAGLSTCQGGAQYFSNGVPCMPSMAALTPACLSAYQNVVQVYQAQTGFTGQSSP